MDSTFTLRKSGPWTVTGRLTMFDAVLRTFFVLAELKTIHLPWPCNSLTPRTNCTVPAGGTG